jgi:hypothetical protein
MDPIYDKLGQEFSKSSIVIAKIDCSKNDVPTEYKSDKFPRFDFQDI